MYMSLALTRINTVHFNKIIQSCMTKGQTDKADVFVNYYQSQITLVL